MRVWHPCLLIIKYIPKPKIFYNIKRVFIIRAPFYLPFVVNIGDGLVIYYMKSMKYIPRARSECCKVGVEVRRVESRGMVMIANICKRCKNPCFWVRDGKLVKHKLSILSISS